MSTRRFAGVEARRKNGFLTANMWLIARRIVQLSILTLFAAGPLFGLWLVKGTLSSSLTLGVLPLTDPLIVIQSLFARHLPEMTALIGAAIVLVTYIIFGGRLYCSWVCPINPVTDLAAYLRRHFSIETDWKVTPQTRYWVLAGVILSAALTQTIAFELVNPITTLYRGLLFGVSLGLTSIVVIFLLDLFVAKHAWCGHLCPVGAFYNLANHTALIRVSAHGRNRCDDCMDCYAVCPEMHVIAPALKGQRTGTGPIIASSDCTACGRCIDVCPERVFNFAHRFDQSTSAMPKDGTTGGSPLQPTAVVATAKNRSWRNS